jgi:hypothetical protein
MERLSTEDYFLASHGELNEKGVCRYCLRNTDLDRFFCGGIVLGDTSLTDEEKKVIEEVGVECEKCHHIYHEDDLVKNGEYELCGNCDTRPGFQNVEPLPYIWVWAAVNDLLPLN